MDSPIWLHLLSQAGNTLVARKDSIQRVYTFPWVPCGVSCFTLVCGLHALEKKTALLFRINILVAQMARTTARSTHIVRNTACRLTKISTDQDTLTKLKVVEGPDCCLSTFLRKMFFFSFCVAFYFKMKIFSSDWPCLIRNHLSFLFLYFVL